MFVHTCIPVPYSYVKSYNANIRIHTRDKFNFGDIEVWQTLEDGKIRTQFFFFYCFPFMLKCSFRYSLPIYNYAVFQYSQERSKRGIGIYYLCSIYHLTITFRNKSILQILENVEKLVSLSICNN